MSDEVDHERRHFFGAAAMTVAAAQFVLNSSAEAQPEKQGTSDTRALKPGASASFGLLKKVNAGVLSIAYAEAGPADGPPVLLLHGWPYDIHSFVDVAPILANAGYRDAVSLIGYAAQRPARGGRHRCYQFSGCAQTPEGPRCGIRLGRQNCKPDGVSLA